MVSAYENIYADKSPSIYCGRLFQVMVVTKIFISVAPAKSQSCAFMISLGGDFIVFVDHSIRTCSCALGSFSKALHEVWLNELSLGFVMFVLFRYGQDHRAGFDVSVW